MSASTQAIRNGVLLDTHIVVNHFRATPIPQTHIWMAAQASEHQLPIATYDAHFAQMRGLTVLDGR